MLCNLVSGKSSLPGLQMPLPYHAHMAEGEMVSLVSLPLRTLILFIRILPSCDDYLSSITLGIRALTYGFGAHRHSDHSKILTPCAHQLKSKMKYVFPTQSAPSGSKRTHSIWVALEAVKLLGFHVMHVIMKSTNHLWVVISFSV